MNNEKFDDVFSQVDQLFKQTDKMFKTMEQHMDDIFTKYKTEENKKAKWEPVKIYWPKRIKGKWYYFGKTAYRKFCLSPGGGFWEYGNDFDAIKEC